MAPDGLDVHVFVKALPALTVNKVTVTLAVLLLLIAFEQAGAPEARLATVTLVDPAAKAEVVNVPVPAVVTVIDAVLPVAFEAPAKL